MNINQLTERLADRFDITADSAGRIAETYLVQIERTDGRIIDRDDIGDGDAESVADAIDAGMGSSTTDIQLADELVGLSERIREHRDELEELVRRRDELVKRLLDRANSVKDISEWSGLSRARIHAIGPAR